MKRLFLAILFYLFVSCSPKFYVDHLKMGDSDGKGSFVFISGRDEIPESAQKLGTMTVAPRYLTTTKKGTYDEVLRIAREQTVKSGGNAAFIGSHYLPDATHATHRIVVDMLQIPDSCSIHINKKDSIHPEYASVWLYRYNWFPSCTYDVYIDEDCVYWSKGGTMTEVRFYESGQHEIWAKVEKRVSLPIQVEVGKDYYIETNVWSGALVPNPLLFQVSEFAGREACVYMEYIDINTK